MDLELFIVEKEGGDRRWLIGRMVASGTAKNGGDRQSMMWEGSSNRGRRFGGGVNKEKRVCGGEETVIERERIILKTSWCLLRKKHRFLSYLVLTKKMGSLRKMRCPFRISPPRPGSIGPRNF